jgi:hypothetical protein
MKPATTKITALALAFLLFSTPVFAEGFMSVRFGATAQFIYVQVINNLAGYLSISTDVTQKVPYEIQNTADEKILVID